MEWVTDFFIQDFYVDLQNNSKTGVIPMQTETLTKILNHEAYWVRGLI